MELDPLLSFQMVKALHSCLACREKAAMASPVCIELGLELDFVKLSPKVFLAFGHHKIKDSRSLTGLKKKAIFIVV